MGSDDFSKRRLDDSCADVFSANSTRGAPRDADDDLVLVHCHELYRAGITLKKRTENVLDDALNGFTHSSSMGNCPGKRKSSEC